MKITEADFAALVEKAASDRHVAHLVPVVKLYTVLRRQLQAGT